MKKQKGFSLIELLVAVAIVAILASIAMPNYDDYVRKGKIVEATSGLSDGRVRMEQFFQDNRFYGVAPCPNETANFTFTCTNPGGPNTYTITATGRASLLNFSYTIDQNNARTSTIPVNWGGTGLLQNCWVTKRGGTC